MKYDAAKVANYVNIFTKLMIDCEMTEQLYETIHDGIEDALAKGTLKSRKKCLTMFLAYGTMYLQG